MEIYHQCFQHTPSDLSDFIEGSFVLQSMQQILQINVLKMKLLIDICTIFCRILKNMHPSVKFGWNWSSGSGEEYLYISSIYFCYFIFISPQKARGPSIWKKMNPLYPQIVLCQVWYKLFGINCSSPEKFLLTDRRATVSHSHCHA